MRSKKCKREGAWYNKHDEKLDRCSECVSDSYEKGRSSAFKECKIITWIIIGMIAFTGFVFYMGFLQGQFDQFCRGLSYNEAVWWSAEPEFIECVRSDYNTEHNLIQTTRIEVKLPEGIMNPWSGYQ